MGLLSFFPFSPLPPPSCSLFRQAKGLHHDIKPHNILLDEHHARAKLGDLGLARLLREEHAVSTTIAGSGPYLDHSYVVDGRYLPESDVYSFGVTVLETMTGTRQHEGGWLGRRRPCRG